MAYYNRCEEVQQASSSTPRPVFDPPPTYAEFQPNISSERKDESSRLDFHPDSNKLCILLNDVEDVTRFSKFRFLKPRMITLSNLKDNLNGNKSMIDVAESILDTLDKFIRASLDWNSTSRLREWEEKRNYYIGILKQTCDPVNPSPVIPPKPNSTVNMQSYQEVLRKMVKLCCTIEKEVRLSVQKLNKMDEASKRIRQKIQQFRKMADFNSGKIEKLFNEEYVGIYCRVENVEQNMYILKRELQRRVGQCDSAKPRLYSSQAQGESLADIYWTPPSCGLLESEFTITEEVEEQRHNYPQDAEFCPGGRTRTPGGDPAREDWVRDQVDVFPSCPGQEPELRSCDRPNGRDAARGACSRTQVDILPSCPRPCSGNRSQAVNDLVGRYDNLQHTVRGEVENIKNQQELLNKTEELEKKRASR